MRPIGKAGGMAHDRSSWAVPLLLLVAVLVPSGCVLWYMSEAVQGQRDAAQRRLTEAWRGQLALVRDHLDRDWEKRAAELDAHAGKGQPGAVFSTLTRDGLADSVVVLNRDGSLAYPTPFVVQQPERPAADPRWVEARMLESSADGMAQAAALWGKIAASEKDACAAARAAQSQIRCLMQGGNKAAALQAIERHFGRGRRPPCASDSLGRVIQADAQLLALTLTRGDPRAAEAASKRLSTLVNDYDSPMPAAQRLFLMQELNSQSGIDSPTLEAERLAASFLEADRARAGDAVLRASGLPGVWKVSSPGGRVIALYRTATVQKYMTAALDSGMPSKGMRFSALPPGGKTDQALEVAAAGSRLPGWQVALAVDGTQPFENPAERRMTSYLWVGCGAIALMALLAVVAGQAMQKQMRVARLKTDLVATVSHELKTPLSSMRLLVDSLLEEATPDPVKTREYLEMVAKENLRLSRLIDNFLTFSRMERNRHKFEFTETSANDLLKAVEEAANERFHAPDCQFSVEVTAGLPALRADRDALVTVLLNLLDNAYKFTGSEKRISLRAAGDGNGRVVFSVEDNGIGIAPRDQKKIFRRFYQVDRRLSRATGGCGLGLSIVEFIVRAHSGEIAVHSRPGVGSVFSVSLPSTTRMNGATV